AIQSRVRLHSPTGLQGKRVRWVLDAYNGPTHIQRQGAGEQGRALDSFVTIPDSQSRARTEREGGEMIVKAMNRQQVLATLTSSRLGRIACSNDGQPYVVPITFSFLRKYLYSYSMLGQKIDWMRLNPKVCVQVDDLAGDREWKSVVIDGVYEDCRIVLASNTNVSARGHC